MDSSAVYSPCDVKLRVLVSSLEFESNKVCGGCVKNRYGQAVYHSNPQNLVFLGCDTDN